MPALQTEMIPAHEHHAYYLLTLSIFQGIFQWWRIHTPLVRLPKESDCVGMLPIASHGWAFHGNLSQCLASQRQAAAQPPLGQILSSSLGMLVLDTK